MARSGGRSPAGLPASNQHRPLLYLTLYFAAFNTLLFGTLRLITPYVLTRLGADRTAVLSLIVAAMNLGGLIVAGTLAVAALPIIRCLETRIPDYVDEYSAS